MILEVLGAAYLNPTYFWSMAILWGSVAILGGVVAVYALLSFRTSRSTPMLALGAGLLLLSVAPAVVWLGVYGITDDIYSASMGCAGLMAAGFLCLFVAARARFT
jgi:hypothetical protein